MLCECNSWLVDAWGDELHRQLTRCVRATYALGGEKLEYFDTVLVLLTRLGEPGVRERCLQQLSEAGNHHRVTLDFLQDGSPLRAAID